MFDAAYSAKIKLKVLCIMDIQYCQSILEFLHSECCNELIYISLNNNMMNEFESSEFARQLYDNMFKEKKFNLHGLSFVNNLVGNEAMHWFRNIFLNCKNLQQIQFNKNGIKDFTSLVNGLRNCTNIQRLDFSENVWNKSCCYELLKVLKKQKKLEMLSLINCDITELESIAISKVVRENSDQIKYINFLNGVNELEVLDDESTTVDDYENSYSIVNEDGFEQKHKFKRLTYSLEDFESNERNNKLPKEKTNVTEEASASNTEANTASHHKFQRGKGSRTEKKHSTKSINIITKLN